MTAEAPLIVVTEVQPQESTTFSVDASVRIFCEIMDSTTRQLVDPDTLTLTFTPPYASPTTYTYGVGGITKNQVGVYYADVPLSAAGKWKLFWLAGLNSIDCGSNTTEIYAVALSGY